MTCASPRGIDAVPCDIPDRRVRLAIARVFTAIRSYPRDWSRLRRRLQAIEYFEVGSATDATLGEWIVDRDEAVRLARIIHEG